MSLVGHWPLHEQSGRANDLSGDGNHGTVNGAIQGVAGKSGLTSYSFDGVDDHINAGTDVIDSNSDFSITAWIRLPSVSSNNFILDERDGNYVGTNLRVNSDGTVAAIVDDGTNIVNATTNTTVDDLSYHHITCTYNKSAAQMSVYIDGSLNITGSNSSIGNSEVSDTCGIGIASGGVSGGLNTTGYFSGEMADVRIYDRALSPQEIQTLYEAGATTGQPLNGTSRYKFEGDVIDSWGSNDGTDNTSVGYVDGRIGKSAKAFDGVDDYVSYNSSIHNHEKGSIAFWTYADSGGSGTLRHIYLESSVNTSDGFGQPTSSGDNDFGAGILDTDAMRFVWDAGTAEGVRLEESITHDTWEHWIGTWENGGNVTLYKNGTKVASQSISNASFTSFVGKAEIGRAFNGTRHHDGSVDDVRLYPYVLKSDEVKAIYEGWNEPTLPSLSDGTDSSVVSRYTFDNTVVDAWGANDGTDNTSAGYSSDAIRGMSKSFDGTDDYVEVANDASLNFGITSFSFGGWFLTNQTGAGEYLYPLAKNAASPGYFIRKSNDDTVTAAIRDGTNDAFASSSKQISSGVWNHIFASIDRTSEIISLYLNGVKVDEVDTSSVGSVDNTKSLYIGLNDPSTQSNTFWDGDIDDVRIYNRALESWEVAELYRWGTRGRDMRKELVKR